MKEGKGQEWKTQRERTRMNTKARCRWRGRGGGGERKRMKNAQRKNKNETESKMTGKESSIKWKKNWCLPWQCSDKENNFPFRNTVHITWDALWHYILHKTRINFANNSILFTFIIYKYTIYPLLLFINFQLFYSTTLSILIITLHTFTDKVELWSCNCIHCEIIFHLSPELNLLFK